MMFVFVSPESKASITELFTVADFDQIQYPVQIQRWILHFKGNCHLF